MSSKLMTLHDECFLFLLRSSLRSIPFNFILALIFSGYLLYIAVPHTAIAIWLIIVFAISSIRLSNSKSTLRSHDYIDYKKYAMYRFVLFTALMGGTWGIGYWVFFPYLSGPHEIVIMLLLGGMASGASASLAIYLPAYYAYLFPMFIPVIIYNLTLFQPDRIVLGLMFLSFLLMLVINARTMSQLLQDTIALTNDKDLLISKLKRLTDAQLKSLQEIKVLSITDSLTGLYNRRYFEMKFQDELNRAQRNSYSLNLILIDIDDFKHINDHYGHPTGDLYLKHLAEAIQHSSRRANDSAFRIGGDEFTALFSNATVDEAVKNCEQIQERFKENVKSDATISIGVLFIPPSKGKDKITDIISAADKTLYQAKAEGKGKIVSKNLH